MPFQDGELGHVAEKAKIQWYDKILTFIMFLMLIMMFVNFQQNQRIQETQRDGVIRSYIQRAVLCDLAKAIGSSEPARCDDSEIQQYRDKNIVPNSTAGARASQQTREAVCEALLSLKNPQVNQICER